MTDNEFNRKLKAAALAAQKHQELSRECEEEYQKRFGVCPAEVDDDFFIDCIYYGRYIPTIEEIHDNAQLHKNNRPNY